MPRWVLPLLLVVGSLALLPFACVARSRVMRSPAPRVHVVPDMDDQGKYKSQQRNTLFADGRAMRPHPSGTVARGALETDDHLYRGVVDDNFAEEFPLDVTSPVMRRGRERYGVFCAPCHGLSGYGDGIVSARADKLAQGTWVPPASLHVEPALSRPVGHLYNSITNGIRNMPSYRSQILVEDRWAIVAYVRALQRSQRAVLDDVPPENRSGLR